jgi:hypothetical protein
MTEEEQSTNHAVAFSAIGAWIEPGDGALPSNDLEVANGNDLAGGALEMVGTAVADKGGDGASASCARRCRKEIVHADGHLGAASAPMVQVWRRSYPRLARIGWSLPGDRALREGTIHCSSYPLRFLMASAPPAEDGAELNMVVFVRLKGWFYEV